MLTFVLFAVFAAIAELIELANLSAVTASLAMYAVAIAVPCQTPVPIVPTEVNDEVTIVDLREVPVKVDPAAVIVIALLPSKLVPLIALGVAKVVAVVALPDKAP